jgi:hypothetical protein
VFITQVEVVVVPNLAEHLVWVVLEEEVMLLLLVLVLALPVEMVQLILAVAAVLVVALILHLTQAAQADQA